MKLDINEMYHNYIVRVVIFGLFTYKRIIRQPNVYKQSVFSFVKKRLAWKINLMIDTGPQMSKDEEREIVLNEILEGKHPSYQTLKLKKRMIKDGIRENKCEICGIVGWNDKPLSMQLDHIDGNSHNHKLENLRLTCPNCHSQTETYCGKNK